MELVTVSTVLVPAVAAFKGQQPYDLVALAAVKTELGLTSDSKDALLQGWITQASAAAAKFCDRVFPVETVQDQIFPPRDYFPAPTVIGGLKPLQLSRTPIAAQPSPAGTAPPIAPVLSAVGGGSLPGTYYARITYVTPTGETAPSAETLLSVASGLLQVASPAADQAAIATGWNCYIGTKSSAETLQNAAPIAIGTAFTLPTTGLLPTTAPLPAFVLAIENNRPLAEGTDFLCKPAAGELVRLDTNGWPKRWPALITLVQFPAGFTITNPIFADLADAVTRMVKGRYFARKRDPGLRSENITGAYEATYWFASGPGAAIGNLTPDVEAILEKYRTPVTG